MENLNKRLSKLSKRLGKETILKEEFLFRIREGGNKRISTDRCSTTIFFHLQEMKTRPKIQNRIIKVLQINLTILMTAQQMTIDKLKKNLNSKLLFECVNLLCFEKLFIYFKQKCTIFVLFKIRF